MNHQDVRAAIMKLCVNGNDITTTTYNRLTDVLGLPPVGEAWNAHPLNPIFETMDQDDVKKKSPMITALVVNSDTGIPGPGFFKAYLRLNNWGGRHDDRLGEQESRVLHSELMRDIRKYYKNH